MNTKSVIIIIGGGPAGLFSAYCLLKEGYGVELYDGSSGLAKKFLIAGNGGLNLTHSEDLEAFSSRYGKDRKLFKNLLAQFSPTDLQNWCHELGVETFVGTSGRIFPKNLKSNDILAKWITALNSFEGFKLHLNHRLVGLSKEKQLTFQTQEGNVVLKAETIIFAMGGASYKKTGSDGLWRNLFEPLGLKIAPFLAMNCGFEKAWSAYFKIHVEHAPLKNITLHFQEQSVKGELMLTPYGLEGGVIYALSNFIRDEIIRNGSATISLDLRPDSGPHKILEKIKNKKQKSSMSNHLRKTLNIDQHEFILLKELISAQKLADEESLSQKIKKLEIQLSGIRPIDEAISTSGGVCFSELNQYMEAKTIPGVYFAGEMLDYEAPTGGHLLQACFSTAWVVVKGIIKRGGKLLPL